MRQALLIVLKDLRRRLRNPIAVISMMLIPITITLIIGLVFGRSGEVELPRIRVLLIDKDDGIFSHFLRQSMQQEQFAEMIELVEVDGNEGRAAIERGEASALLEIPENFTDDLLDHKPVQLGLKKNPAEAFLPVIVQELVETTALMLDSGVRIFGGPIEQLRSMFEGEGWPSRDDAGGLLDSSRDNMILVGGYMADSLISLRNEVAEHEIEEEGAGVGLNIFAFVLPGSLLIGLLFISQIALRDIVREKEYGTLARLFTAPLEAGHVVAGKILSAFAITGLSCILLVLVGRFAFGISLGKPLPLVFHLVATVFMCTGVITLCYGFIRSDRAADAVLPVVILTMCLLGGSMIPYEQMGATLQDVGRFSPVFWAVDGLKMVFIERANLSDISLHLGILYGLGILTVVPGTALLRKRMRSGG
ncbi:MAG: ABC transporter permease [Candidatus Eiseniibacteriota bacterium]|nr:MAG: ABC transporter permease [Candidatus Eisenbacteria bacterium]